MINLKKYFDVMLHVGIRYKIIKKNVLIGNDGWLFLYKGKQSQFDFLRNMQQVSKNSIDNFTSNIISRADFFLKLNIAYKHIVFPSKPLVKASFLPSVYSDVSSLYKRYYEAPIQHSNASKNVLYPLDKLLEVELLSSTYHKYDTHNSSTGFLTIANELLNSLGYGSIPENLLKYMKKSVGGDLAAMLSIGDTHEEEFITLSNKFYSIDNRNFLKSNTGYVRIFHNNDALTNKRVVIFGDSFFEGLFIFLQYMFVDILFIRSKFIHKDIIDKFRPDIVLTGNAERYLSKVKSDDEANDFFQDLYAKNHFLPNDEFSNALEAQMVYKDNNDLYKKWVDKKFGHL